MKSVDIENLIDVIQMFAIKGAEITETTPLLESDVIDSLNVIQIIAELESRWSINIGAMSLTFNDFATPLSLKSALDSLLLRQ